MAFVYYLCKKIFRDIVKDHIGAMIHISLALDLKIPKVQFFFFFVLNLILQQQFGGSSGSQLPQIQTDVVLPSCKKKAPPETPVKERLFIVFNPHPLPLDVLEDIFW